MVRFLAISSLFFAVSACGIFGGKPDEVVFDTALGPETELQIRQLPGGLGAPEGSPAYLGKAKGEDLEDEGL